MVNSRFGWLADETGCGHLWQGNARESPITDWNNDPLSIGGPEWFLLSYAGETHSLFADGDKLPTTVTYGFGWMRWEKQWKNGIVRTTAFVPWDKDQRLLLVTLPDGAGKIQHISLRNEEKAYCFTETLCLVTDRSGTVPCRPPEYEKLFQDTAAQWKRMVCPLTIETPDVALNHYLNGWCLYQVIACRLLARTSHYQNGGAFGFRDQLQDTLPLLPFAPDWTKSQILRCCAHQFQEGDVQHWWHEVGQETTRGVRTRISDDLLWLPYVLEQYVETWSNWDILSEKTAYLAGEPLKEEERERYFAPEYTTHTEDIYTHALRAIRCVLDRDVGVHGLLKIGTGDWNDGMDQVGRRGQGESVWLTWFAVSVLEHFTALAEYRQDKEAKVLCQEWAKRLKTSAEEAWDGKWYLRGWYDNGAPLGSHTSEECQLDSISQSWAVLSGGDREKTKIALRSSLDLLFDRKNGIIKLFTPAFDDSPAQPGYIKGYLPGIRENGGQYTHAATWLALACFQIGWKEEGYQLLRALLPSTHPSQIYQAEPFVLAGDVYSHPDHVGRGGWSWYTGAAGWYHQAVWKGLLGIEIKHGNLTVAPRLPADWPGCSVKWALKQGTLQIMIRRGGEKQMLLDGLPVDSVPLSSLRGEHQLEVTAEKETPRENSPFFSQ